MQALIWIGAGLTLAGVALLFWCIFQVAKARRTARDDAEMQARMQRAVAVNMAALGLSGIGLMSVVTGIILG